MTKHWTQSKTLWINILALIASVAAAFGFDITGEAQASLVAGILALANIGLRLVTRTAVTK